MIQLNRKRVYWILCALLVALGLLGMILAGTYARSDGEMPPEFAIATWVMLLGIIATVLGLVWVAARKLLGRS